MIKILFICTGNTCRSSMAEALLKKILKDHGIEDIEVDSAGIAVFSSSGASKHAIEVMKERKIDLSTHRSKQVTKDLIQQANLIFTMTTQHRDRILHLCPSAADKTFTLKEYANVEDEHASLNISDPFGMPKEYYEKCAREIYNALEKMIDNIKRDQEK